MADMNASHGQDGGPLNRGPLNDARSGGAWLRFVAVVALLGVAMAIAAGLWARGELDRPGPAVADAAVIVPPGAGVRSIADLLEAEGLVHDSRVFYWYARLSDEEGPLRAGEFMIPAQANVRDVAEVLRRGAFVQHPITVPEGSSSLQILEIINNAEPLSGDPIAAIPEGSLLPETYMVTRGSSRAALVERMDKAMDAFLAEAWAARDPDTPLRSPEEALILASIVEKETGVAAERDLVASVFINRLRRPMRLQSDPTIIYGLTGGLPLGRGLRQSELDKPNEYNTYQIDRLPPTPISHPSRASIEAVLKPPSTDALYFVADGTGGHVFARTLAEHNRNVAQWRAIERARGAAQ